MSKELAMADRAEEMDRVVREYIKGETNALAISRKTEIPRVRVLEYIKDFKQIASSDENIREMAQASILTLVQHYDLLIKELHSNSEEMQSRGDFKGSSAALKSAGDLEAKRQEQLQKAGLYDDAGMADEVVKLRGLMEKYKELLVRIASNNPVVKKEIQEGLREIYGQAPPVPEKPKTETIIIEGETA